MRRVVMVVCLGGLTLGGGIAAADELQAVPAAANEGAVSTLPPADPAVLAEAAQARRELDAVLAQMGAVAQRVRDDLRLARKRGIKVQIACFDRALSRADAATRWARETAADALTAYDRDDVEGARVARRRLAEIRESQRRAATDSTACAQQALPRAPSSTTVTMERL